MQTKILKSLALLFALASVNALAQGNQPPDPATMIQHQVSFLTNKLGLSSSQQQQATTIYTNAMSGMQSVHQQMKAAHQALQEAVSKGDNTGIEQASNTIGNLTSQMTAAHAKADAQFMQILSSDQQSRFTQMQSRGPGFGGPGGRFFHGGSPQ